VYTNHKPVFFIKLHDRLNEAVSG